MMDDLRDSPSCFQNCLLYLSRLLSSPSPVSLHLASDIKLILLTTKRRFQYTSTSPVRKPSALMYDPGRHICGKQPYTRTVPKSGTWSSRGANIKEPVPTHIPRT